MSRFPYTPPALSSARMRNEQSVAIFFSSTLSTCELRSPWMVCLPIRTLLFFLREFPPPEWSICSVEIVLTARIAFVEEPQMRSQSTFLVYEEGCRILEPALIFPFQGAPPGHFFHEWSLFMTRLATFSSQDRGRRQHTSPSNTWTRPIGKANSSGRPLRRRCHYRLFFFVFLVGCLGGVLWFGVSLF